LRNLLDEEKTRRRSSAASRSPKKEAAGEGRRFVLTYPNGDKRTVSAGPTRRPWTIHRQPASKPSACGPWKLPDPTVELIFTQDQKDVAGN